MKITVTGRAMGKTTKAVEWVMGSPKRKLAVFSEQEKRRIVSQYKIEPSKIIVFGSGIKSDQGLDCEIGIDNAEFILERFFNNRISKVWMTGEYESNLESKS